MLAATDLNSRLPHPASPTPIAVTGNDENKKEDPDDNSNGDNGVASGGNVGPVVSHSRQDHFWGDSVSNVRKKCQKGLPWPLYTKTLKMTGVHSIIVGCATSRR